jgi:hypothetical protein
MEISLVLLTLWLCMRVYAEGNMESIVAMIPIDISKTPGVVENVFVGVDFSPEEIQIYTELFKEFPRRFFLVL